MKKMYKVICRITFTDDGIERKRFEVIEADAKESDTNFTFYFQGEKRGTRVKKNDAYKIFSKFMINSVFASAWYDNVNNLDVIKEILFCECKERIKKEAEYAQEAADKMQLFNSLTHGIILEDIEVRNLD